MATPDQIIRWRKQASGYASQQYDINDGVERWGHIADTRFAQLVAQHERERCEQACGSVYHQHIGPDKGEVRYGISVCISAIRALKD